MNEEYFNPPNTENHDAYINVIPPSTPPPPEVFSPVVPTSQSFRKLDFNLHSKRRRAYFSMFISTASLGLFGSLLFLDSTQDLKMVSISMISSIVSVWLSNIKAGKGSSDNASE